MSFVNINSNVYSEIEKIAAQRSLTVGELAHEAFNFYAAYLKYVGDEQQILQMLGNLQSSDISVENKKKELQNTKESLANYFFKEVNQKIQDIEISL